MLVLLPLCGAGGLGGQVEHDPGDARDLLDLVHHLQHHLFGDLVSGRGGDPRHEVAGDEGADDHGALAGRLLLQGVAVKVQRCEDDGHLADLTGVAGLSEDRVGHKVGLSERAQNTGGQEGRSDGRQGLLHVGSKHINHSGERGERGARGCRN